MIRSKTNPTNKKTILAIALGLSVIGTLAVTSTPARAQQSVALSGVTVSQPQQTTIGTLPPVVQRDPIGISVSGWQLSSSTGQAYGAGGDGKGQSSTLADGFFRIGADTYLTGNANPDCKVDCSNTQAKLWITGEQLTGARNVNQGTGNGVVSSVAGTNGMFGAGLQVMWQYAQPPKYEVSNQPTPATTAP